MIKRERKYDYFKNFQQMGKSACEAAKMLTDILKNFDPQAIPEQTRAMHKVEHNADIIHHDMLNHLTKEFITPIEREDIMLIGQELDSVVDCIEDVVQKLYMYNVQSVPDEAVEMAHIIEKCCEAMSDSLDEFSNYKKSSRLNDFLIEINRLEEDGDILYLEANRRLYTSAMAPLTIYSWGNILTFLENCCDSCEHVAEAMETVIMKNS